jgi:hypothetical protein
VEEKRMQSSLLPEEGQSQRANETFGNRKINSKKLEKIRKARKVRAMEMWKVADYCYLVHYHYP